jgi:hypothetical protein
MDTWHCDRSLAENAYGCKETSGAGRDGVRQDQDGSNVMLMGRSMPRKMQVLRELS